MAYDRQFLRVSFLFTIALTDEVAVTSINYSVVPNWTGAAAALAEVDLGTGTGTSLLGRMATLMGTAQVGWADYSRLNAVKIAAVGTNGLNLTDPKLFEDSTPASGASTTTLPQSTIVGTLFSGTSFGTANYGRMYLPHTKFQAAAGTPRPDISVVSTVCTTFAGFVSGVTTDLNADTTDTVQPFIMSNAAPAPSKPVHQVRVGDITDTQRRRRNRLKEVYAAVTL